MSFKSVPCLSLLWILSVSCMSQTKELMVLVGSTPADENGKFNAGIPWDEAADFIRWRIILNDASKTYSATITYGKAQQNTNGFVNGGKKKTHTGTYSIRPL